MDQEDNCLICEADLKYEDECSRMICSLCGEEYESKITCVDGHYICNKCYFLSANDLIKRICVESELENPLEMAINIMKNQRIAMHGPQHHFMVPAVLLSSYYNLKNDLAMKEEKIKVAQERAVNVLGGFCGFYGDCGAAVGTGIFISLVTDASPLSSYEWKLSNLMTARSLFSLAHIGGPRCCKRTTIMSIQSASLFAVEYLGIKFPGSNNIKCDFSSLNNECLFRVCPFYSENN
ncbi:MAG: DUF5714 domain-containing protein [Dehalococcoidales bacterium]|nr:DUF5714 domain-containing protein [Dehalococcoidales bacterium]